MPVILVRVVCDSQSTVQSLNHFQMTLSAQFDISGRRHVEYGNEPHGGLLHGQWVHEHTIEKVFVDLRYVAGHDVPLPQKRPAIADTQIPAAAGEGN